MRNIYLLFIGLIVLFSCSEPQQFDILILNAEVFDGSGSDAQRIDVGIIKDEIKALGDLSKSKGVRVIDAKGLTVSPGFIDMHTHLDPIMELLECESMIRQGVTTSLGGPDGSSPMPLGSYMDTLAKKGVGMNVGYLIGHNTIRNAVMQMENRAPTKDELERMKSLVQQGMDDGAFGISTGLKYLPGAFSNVDEVIELSKVAGGSGGIYTSHLREEGLGLFDAVQEAIQISAEANIPVILTHHKVMGKPMWGKSVRTLAMVDSARAAGLDIKIDQYPYNASHTSISVLIPGWSRAGGDGAFKERVTDPVLRDSIKNGIIFNIINDRGGNDLSRVQFSFVRWNKELQGKTLKYWCEQRGLEPSVENGADLVIEAQLNGGANCIFHAMDEEDVERIMQHPMTMIGSDGRLVKPGQGHPHPRWYGTFPRILGRYVRENTILTLSEAIYKMTGFSAQTLGLEDRGLIKEGLKADITIFNPETIIDKATFTEPHQYPEGIEYVIINGQMAVDQGEFKDVRAGKVLKRN